MIELHFLPDRKLLPEALYPLADEFDAATARVEAMEEAEAEAVGAVGAGRTKDGEALKAYALGERKTAPIPKEHEQAARARLEQAEQAVKIAEAARKRVGDRLIREARKVENRDHIARAAAEVARPALDEYRKVLDEAARAVELAGAKVLTATEGLGFVKDLDDPAVSYVSTSSPVTLPSLGLAEHRKRIDRLASLLDRFEGPRPTPSHRLTTRGLVKTDHIPGLLRARRAHDPEADYEYVDGYPPVDVPEHVSTGVSRARRVRYDGNRTGAR